MAKTRRQKKVEPIDIKITIGDTEYCGEGKTMAEAIESIKPPHKVLLKGTIRVRNGDKQFEQVWFPQRFKRFFRPLARNVVSKELTFLLK